LTTGAIDCSGQATVWLGFETLLGVFSVTAEDNAIVRVSTDGTTWTERTGKGGDWCINLLGKWIVCTYAYSYNDAYRAHTGRDYRISDDTINWTEGLTFWLSNDAPEYDEQGTEITPAGPLYHQYFYPTRDQFSVINGKIVIPSIVNGKLCITAYAIKHQATKSA